LISTIMYAMRLLIILCILNALALSKLIAQEGMIFEEKPKTTDRKLDEDEQHRFSAGIFAGAQWDADNEESAFSAGILFTTGFPDAGISKTLSYKRTAFRAEWNHRTGDNNINIIALLPEYHLTNNFSVFAGPGFYFVEIEPIVDSPYAEPTTDTRFFIRAGIALNIMVGRLVISPLFSNDFVEDNNFIMAGASISYKF
jgi:hypothetical protein